MLKERVEELSQEGLRAEFLSTNDLLSEEPELVLEQEGGAAFFPDDYQLDVHRTVAFIAEVCSLSLFLSFFLPVPLWFLLSDKL